MMMKKVGLFCVLCFVVQCRTRVRGSEDGWAKKEDLALLPYTLAKSVGIRLFAGVAFEVARWFGDGEVLYAVYANELVVKKKLVHVLDRKRGCSVEYKSLSLVILKEPDIKLEARRFWWVAKDRVYDYQTKPSHAFWWFEFGKKMCKAKGVVGPKMSKFDVTQWPLASSRVFEPDGLYAWTNQDTLGFMMRHCGGLDAFFPKDAIHSVGSKDGRLYPLDKHPCYSTASSFPRKCVNVMTKGTFVEKRKSKQQRAHFHFVAM